MSRFDNPVFDGIAPSWADIALRITPNGGTLIEIGDVSAVNTGTTVEVGEQREGGRVIKRTTGSVSYEASMTLYASGYLKLLRGIRDAAPAQGNQRRISLVHFTVNLQWTPPGSDEILEKRLKGCRILGDTLDAAEGTDAQQIEIPLNPLEIVTVVDGVEFLLI